MMSAAASEDMILRINPTQIIPMELGSRLQSSAAIIELGKKLLQASREGDTDSVRTLMSKGAPFTTDWLGTSALHLAAMNAHEETCEVLLRSGISRDTRTKVDRTPLHFAAYEGHANICKLLIQHGAQPDCRDMLQMTPLHWAVVKGHAACAEVLAGAGADPSATSKFRRTPLSLAAAAGRRDLVDLLHAALLDRTVLHGADALPEVPRAGAPGAEAGDAHHMTVEEEAPACEEQGGSCSPERAEEDGAAAAFASLLPLQQEAARRRETVQLLRQHGITMLPADDGNTVLSAIQSGRTVVLSDAGKLLLKESETSRPAPAAQPPKPPVVLSAAKMKPPLTISSSQQPAPKVKIFTLNSGGQVLTIPRQTKTTAEKKLQPTIRKIVPSNKFNFINSTTGQQPVPGNNLTSKSNVVKINSAGGKPGAAVFKLEQLRSLQREGLIELRGGAGAGAGGGGGLKLVMHRSNLDKLLASGNTLQPVNVMDTDRTKVAKLINNKGMEPAESNDIEVVRAELVCARAALAERERELRQLRQRLLLYEGPEAR